MTPDQKQQWLAPLLFGLATSTEFAGKADKNFMLDQRFAWLNYTLVRDCARAGKAIENLRSEFGDRAEGAKTLSDAELEFRAWSKTQPQELTMFATGQLGDYSQEKGQFAIRPHWPSLWIAPSQQTPADARLNLIAGGSGGAASSAILKSIQGGDRATKVACRTSDGKELAISFTEISLKVNTLANGKFSSGFTLPPVAMSLEKAKAMVGSGNSRAVRVALTFKPVDDKASAGLMSFSKDIFVSSVRIHGEDGSLIMERRYD